MVHVAERTIGKGGGDLRADEDQLKEEIREQADELAADGLDVESRSATRWSGAGARDRRGRRGDGRGPDRGRNPRTARRLPACCSARSPSGCCTSPSARCSRCRPRRDGPQRCGVRSGVTLEELKKAVAEGTVDTVLLAIADMEGRLQGKRLTASHFLDEVLEHGAEGCNYLLAVDVDMETVGGYAMSSWEQRLRRLRDEARPRHAAPGPLAAGDGDADGRPAVGGRDATCVASPRQILRRQLARLAERGLSANAGTELEFIVFNDTYEEAWKQGLPRPRAGQPLQHRLLAARQRPGRAADPADPQRDGGGRDGGRELEGRVQPRPARDQLPLRRGAAQPPTTTRSTRTAPRRSPPRRATRSPSWPSSTSARATRATSTARSRDEDGGNAFAADRQMFDRFVAGQLACMRELTLLYAPHVNSYKRFVAGLVRADRGRLGPRQPHLLDAGRRPRRGAAGREPAARAPTSTPTWR